MHQEQIWNLIAKKLSGESSPEELRELEGFLRKNPELHYPIQTIMDLWHTSQTNFEEQEAKNAFSKHVERMQQLDVNFSEKENTEPTDNLSFDNRKRTFRITAIALSFCVALFFLGIYFFSAKESSANTFSKSVATGLAKSISEVATKNGSKTNLILPDGTKVWLNAGSSLTYDSSLYGKSVREVSLSGEGFFDVTKNKDKPFIIHAASINIKVLGTEFDVKSYPTEKTTEASLIRGSIEVTFRDKPSKTVILKPNEKIVVDNIRKIETVIQSRSKKEEKVNDVADGFAVKNLTYESKTGDIIETSWVDNKLIFQDESFENIAQQLERWYAVSIVFENENLKENHLTGSFKNETIRQALDALKFTASFNYKIDNNNNITIY